LLLYEKVDQFSIVVDKEESSFYLKVKAVINFMGWHMPMSGFWLWAVFRWDLKELDLADF